MSIVLFMLLLFVLSGLLFILTGYAITVGEFIIETVLPGMHSKISFLDNSDVVIQEFPKVSGSLQPKTRYCLIKILMFVLGKAKTTTTLWRTFAH
jgi:hypothetical protein